MNRRESLCAKAVAASVAAAGLGALADPSHAAATHEILVNAVLLSKSICRFTTNSSTISLSIDTAATSNATATGAVTIRCVGSAATASYAVSNNNGLYGGSPSTLRMRNATLPAEYLNYAMSYPPSGTTPKNVTTTFSVTVSVSPGDFQNMVPGSYSDTVVLTIVP